MPLTAGPVVAAALLLLVAGATKLRDPAPTVTALRSVGVRRPAAWQIRLLAALEVVSGGAVLAGAGRPAYAVLALLYVAFAAFLAVALRSPAASCGCAGRKPTPPTPSHLVMNLGLAAFAVAAVATDARVGLGDLIGATDLLTGLVAIGYAAVVAWLCWLVLAVLPTVRPLAVTTRRNP